MTGKYEFKRLNAILDGDGSEIRQQLILASLLLMIFERFKTYVVGQVDGFFSSHIEIKDGDLNYIRGEKFKALIKEKVETSPASMPIRNFAQHCIGSSTLELSPNMNSMT